MRASTNRTPAGCTSRMCGTATRDQSRPLFRVAYSATHWESPQGSPAASHPTAGESQDALSATNRVGSGCGTYCFTAGVGDVLCDPLGDGVGRPAVDPVDPEPQPATASSAVMAAAATGLATDRVIDPPPRRPLWMTLTPAFRLPERIAKAWRPGDFGIAPTTTRGTTRRVVVGRLPKWRGSLAPGGQRNSPEHQVGKAVTAELGPSQGDSQPGRDQALELVRLQRRPAAVGRRLGGRRVPNGLTE